MGVHKDPSEPIGVGEIHRFAHQIAAVLAVAVEDEGAQRQILDAGAAELEAFGNRRGAFQGDTRRGPVLGRNGGVGMRGGLLQFDHAAPNRTPARLLQRDDLVDALCKRTAGFRAKTAGVHAGLFSQTYDAQSRHAARGADREKGFEQVEGAMLGTLCAGDAGSAAVGEECRLGRTGALEHVEAVGQQRRGFVNPVVLVGHGG